MTVDKFYKTLAREASDAIVYADVAGLIAFWNKGAERIFGFTEAEAMGKSLDLIIPGPQQPRHWAGYMKAVKTGTGRYVDGDILSVPAARKDGTRISVAFTILPFKDKAGRVLGVAAIMRDVTRQSEEVAALRKELAARRTVRP